MKVKKSVFSILVVIIMSITSLGSTLVFAATPDVTNALKRVQSLGVLDSSITDVNSVVTREQFAKALVVADNLSDAAQSVIGSTVYPDVNSDSNLSGYVNILNQKGLLFGTVDGYFHPEKAVTYAEACTSLVKLLGYTDQDVEGTWPSNYISKASNLLLNQKITLKKSDSLTVWAAALMFDRLFITDVKLLNGTTTSKTFLDSVKVDPIYSTPVIVSNFDPTSDKIGDITFDANVPIFKNGQLITKADIQDMDVVYNTTDRDGNNRSIQVFDNKVEGNITGFLGNGASSTGIQIDNANYYYDNNMDLSSISSLKNGSLVAAIQGYDGKIIAVKGIDHKLGKLTQGIIVGNPKTSDNLSGNQVLVSQGADTAVTYYYLKDIGELSIGMEYSFYADGNTITKINGKINSVENYAVSSAVDTTIRYTDDNNITKTMSMPEVSTYYYHGAKVDYNTALSAIHPYSSIVLAKNSDNTGYDYAVIVDPSFSNPQIFKYNNTSLINQLNSTKFNFIRKNDQYLAGLYWLSDEDVVYFVSDLWNRNTYIYVNNAIVTGKITGLLPNKINPNTIQINGTSYVLSPYFNKTKLNNFNPDNYPNAYNNIFINSYVTLVLGVDGKVVDIY